MNVCFVDSVVPPAQSNQAGAAINIPARDIGGAGGALPSVYGVEAGISPTADNATYCRGVQPITIEPMDCDDSDSNDVEPSDVESTAVQQRNILDATPARPDEVTRPAMRVVYCGTVSGDQILEQGSLGGLAPNIISSSNRLAPATSVARTSESRNRNFQSSDLEQGSLGGLAQSIISGSTPAPATNMVRGSESRSRNFQSSDSMAECPVSVERILPSEADSSGMGVNSVQRRSADVSTPPSRSKQRRPSGSRAAATGATVAPSTSVTGSAVTGRKSKSRRARSLDGESTALRPRCVTDAQTYLVVIVVNKSALPGGSVVRALDSQLKLSTRKVTSLTLGQSASR